MGKFWNILGIVAVGTGLLVVRKKNKEAIEEEERRKNTLCKFDEKLSQEDFKNIAYQNCKRIKRIHDLNIVGPIISAAVYSQSGISSWQFTIDFNDYGRITGRYWISSNNDDSSIPSIIADNIKIAVEQRLTKTK